jgi:antitoxin (DNA-binding transcriptional repressor) of toxin-antitoxin stability system
VYLTSSPDFAAYIARVAAGVDLLVTDGETPEVDAVVVGEVERGDAPEFLVTQLRKKRRGLAYIPDFPRSVH